MSPISLRRAARTITAGQVFTQHPQTRVRNVGLYPLEVRGRDSVRVHPHAREMRDGLERRQHRRADAIGVAEGDPPTSSGWYGHGRPGPAIKVALLAAFATASSPVSRGSRRASSASAGSGTASAYS